MDLHENGILYVLMHLISSLVRNCSIVAYPENYGIGIAFCCIICEFVYPVYDAEFYCLLRSMSIHYLYVAIKINTRDHCCTLVLTHNS